MRPTSSKGRFFLVAAILAITCWSFRGIWITNFARILEFYFRDPISGFETVPAGTTLRAAAHFDRGSLVEKLLAGGDDPNGKDPSNSTPLMYAARSGSVHAIPPLLKYGASVNVINADGQNSLMIAAMHRRRDACKLLIAAKPDASLKDFGGKSALDYAKSSGDQEIVLLLETYTKR